MITGRNWSKADDHCDRLLVPQEGSVVRAISADELRGDNQIEMLLGA